MELLLLRISIIKTMIRVLTFCCLFLPLFLTPFITVPNWVIYFSGGSILLLIIQINFIPRYRESGKIQVTESEILIQSKKRETLFTYSTSEIKLIIFEYEGHKGEEQNISIPIFMPMTTKEGIGNIYLETKQNKKQRFHFLAPKNIRKDLFLIQKKFWENEIDFRLII